MLNCCKKSKVIIPNALANADDLNLENYLIISHSLVFVTVKLNTV